MPFPVKKGPLWFRVVFGAVMFYLVYTSINTSLGASVEVRPPEDSLNYMATLLDDGFYYSHGYGIMLAESDQHSVSVILFPETGAPGYSTINEANLTVYYVNNLNYTDSTIIQVSAWYGSDPDLILQSDLESVVIYGPIRNYDIVNWDTEGYYTLDVTAIIQAVVNNPAYNNESNTVIQIEHYPTNDPDYYRYDIEGNAGPRPGRRPTLSIDYTAPSDSDYKGWDITPGSYDPGNVTLQIYNSLNTWELWSYDRNKTEVNYTSLDLYSGGVNARCLEVVNDTVVILGFNNSDNSRMDLFWTNDLGRSWDNITVWTGGYTQYKTMVYDNNTLKFHCFWTYSNTLYYNSVSFNGSIWKLDNVSPVEVDTGATLAHVWAHHNGTHVYCAYKDGSYSSVVRGTLADPPSTFSISSQSTWVCDTVPHILFRDKNIYLDVHNNGAHLLQVLKYDNSITWGNAGAWGLVDTEGTYDNHYGGWMGNSTDWGLVCYYTGSDTVGGLDYPEVCYLLQNETLISYRMNLTAPVTTFIWGHQPYTDINGSLRSIIVLDGLGVYDVPDNEIRTPQTNIGDYLVTTRGDNIQLQAHDYSFDYNPLTASEPSYDPPNGTGVSCVANYLSLHYPDGYNITQLQEAIDYCDNSTSNPDYQGFPDPETDPDLWFVSRRAFKLYFLVLGVVMVVIGFLGFAVTKEYVWLGYMAFLIPLGVGFIIAFMHT